MRSQTSQSRRRRGFTLLELCIVAVIVGIMAVMAVPLYQKAIEQARVDDAGARLQAIWSAQRIYWLDRRVFADSLPVLQQLDLLDASYAASQSNPNAKFVLDIFSASSSEFTARAQRAGSGVWTGQLAIDETGEITGQILGSNGDVLTPAE